MRKFWIGTAVFIGGSYIIILALDYIALNYPALDLNGSIQPPQANVLILSGLTWNNLLFFVAIVGWWLLINRLGLTPRLAPYTPQPGRRPSGWAGEPPAPNDSSRYHSLQMFDDSLSARDTTDTTDESDTSDTSDTTDDRSK